MFIGDKKEIEFDDGWSIDKRIEVLELLDRKALEDGDSVIYATLWHDHGGGGKETEEQTKAWRRELASNEEKFIGALYCFAICMIFDLSWLTPKP